MTNSINADRIEDQEAEIAKLAQEGRLKGAENAELLKQIGALNFEAERGPGLLERIITLESDKRDLEGQVQRSKVVADSVPALKQQIETLKDNLAETDSQLRAATGRTESDATRILSLEATLEYERGLRSLVPPTDAVDQIEEPRDAATNA